MAQDLTRLRRLLAYFENGAASVRTTIAFLEHDPTAPRAARAVNGNGNGHHPVMLDALALDAQRRSGKGTGKRGQDHGPRTGKSKARIHVQRTRSAEVLALFNTDTPKTAEQAGIGGREIAPLSRRGYIKKKRDGYVRTSKPFHVDPKAAAATT